MQVNTHNNYLLILADGVKPPSHIDRLVKAMEDFDLDSCSPIEPLFHGQLGYFEGNVVHHTAIHKVVRSCLMVKKELAEQIVSLKEKDLRKLSDLWEHGLVCNSVLHA